MWTRSLRAARAFCVGLGGDRGQLVVVQDDVAGAVAVPGDGGRVLASRALLAALPAAERRAVILHETAHLTGHHLRYRLAADLAGAVDPLQFRVRAAVRYATERWADETAALAVGDRTVVARALARSALRSAGARPGTGWDAVAMHAGRSGVVRRVQALLAPGPRQRPGLVLAAGVLIACTLAAAGHAQADTETWFEQSTAPIAGSVAPAGG